MPMGDKGGFLEECVLLSWAWEGLKCKVGMGGKASPNLGRLTHTHTHTETERTHLGQRRCGREGYKR